MICACIATEDIETLVLSPPRVKNPFDPKFCKKKKNHARTIIFLVLSFFSAIACDFG